ncbi:hypothetical protein V8C43DRAFT_307199 [Trichoderma afarasin]
MSFDSSNTTSTASSIIFTSKDDSLTIGNLSLQDGSLDTVPWPDKTYMIREKESGLVIGISDGRLYMHEFSKGLDPEPYHWFCVESNGYFGFFNRRNNKYLSSRKGSALCTVSDFGTTEYFFPRRHPNGGYQLLVAVIAVNSIRANQVAILSQDNIIMRQHAGTIWEFVQVS